MNAASLIPPMTHELGRYWSQPNPSLIEVDDFHALMDRKTFDALAEYSCTIPTGTYGGKMWKRRQGEKWFLAWYDERGAARGEIRIRYREILVA